MQATLNKRELIELAVLGEKSSFSLYSRAAVVTGCEKVRKVFRRIARDELAHLLGLLKSFSPYYPELAKQVDITMPAPDRSKVEKLAAITESAVALRWALEEEQQSLHFYAQLSRVVDDNNTSRVLQSIIRDEMSHIRALSAVAGEGIEEIMVRERRFH